MKTVSGRVLSSKPISLSKAASTLSSFLSTDNGASKALCAYLRRASASFNELKQLHKELRPSRSGRKHRNSKIETIRDAEAVGNNSFEDIEGEDVKRRGGGDLKIEVEHTPGRRVERIESKESRDQDQSTATPDRKRKKHKKRSEDEIGDSKLRISDNERTVTVEANGDLVEDVELGQNLSSMIENNVASQKERKKHEDLVNGEDQIRRDIKEENNMELPAKKKKKKKKREQDVGHQQNDSGGLKGEGEGGKKRKNRGVEEGENDGLEEQQGVKKKRRNR